MPTLTVFQLYRGMQNFLNICTNNNKTIGLATISIAMWYFFEIYVILKTLSFLKIIEKKKQMNKNKTQTEII